MSGIWQDLRFASRTLRRERGYAVTVIALMALGITAITTLVSIVSGVLLKPLPWPEPDRLVRLEEMRGGRSGRVPWTISNATYRAWIDGTSSTIEAIGGWFSSEATLRGAGDPQRIRIARITPSLLSVIRARPAMGRLFREDDAGSPANTTTAIVSHDLWRRSLAGGDVLGRRIQLDDRSYTIVGVMPAGLAFPDDDTHVWIPQRIQPVRSPGEKMISVSIFSALVRMRAGVTPEQVAAEATARARAGDDLGPAALALFGTRAAPTVFAVPALDVLTSDVRPALEILLAAVFLLLMTAIGSVAILQLARAASRRRETTVRVALGAKRIHLTRQWLVESALVAGIAGLAGIAGTAALLRGLPTLLPADFPRMADVSLDWRAAVSAAAAIALTTLVGASVPALQWDRKNLVQSLTENGLAVAGTSRHSAAARFRGAIMIGQVAVACLLLIGAGLLTRSLLGLINIDRGYDPHNVLTARLPLPRGTKFGEIATQLESLEERLRSIEGVSAAGFGNALPFVTTGGTAGFSMPSPRDPGVRLQIQTLSRTVSPAYFEAMGLRVIAGRRLDDHDTAGAPAAVVVNRSFAEQYLGGNPVGQRLNFRTPGAGTAATVGLADRGSWDVVGVVEDMRQGGIAVGRTVATADTEQPEMFFSYRQLRESSPESVFIILRTSTDPAALAPTLRALLREHAPRLAVDSVMTMEDRVMASLARPRTYALVLAGFALFALTIAGTGLFGVLSYGVAQRTREIGIRSALGAASTDIMKVALRQAIFIIAAGCMTGIVAAALLASSVAHVLYGVSRYDTVSFLAGPILVVLAGVAACIMPARRAIRVDPLVALRGE